MANIKGKQLASNLSVTNVTASGHISGSNTSTGSFGALNVSGEGTFGSQTTTGDILVSQYIKHKGDENTLINFTDNRIRFNAGGINFLSLEDDGSAPFPFVINNGGNRINFRVMDRNNELLLKTDSEAFNVGLYYAGSKKLETTSAGIDVSNINVTASGHITASGNISSSLASTGSFGTIQTTTGTIPTLLGNTTFNDNLTIAGNLDISDTIYHTGDSNTKIRFPEVDTIAFNTSGLERLRITSDGQISGSSVSTGSFGKLVVGDDIELTEDQRIYFEADKGTYIESHASDTFRVVVNNRQMFLLDEDTGNRAIFGNGTKVFIGANNNRIPTASLHIGGDIWASGSNGHITASGNINSSGTGSFAHVAIGSSIIRDGDSDTKLTFTDDDLNITIGGKNMVDFTEDTVSEVTFNEEGVDIDFRVETTNDNKALYINAGDDSIKLGSSANTHISVSGSISSSASITAKDFSGIFIGALSSSAQIASNISGSFTPASASFSTRITTEEGNVDTLQGRTLTAGDGLTGGGTLASDRTFAVGQGTGVTVNTNDVAIGQDVATTANVTFATITTTGNIESQGDIIAQNYIVSSSVTHMTSSFRSGSTISGDTPSDDTHQFTGSLFISGSTPNDITTTNSILVGNHISASGNITGSQIEASGDVIAFGSSDRRLKDNITPIENPLDKMDKIGGYTFVWNNKQSTYKGKDIGVVAQEIEEILPELVTTRGTGYKAVKYEKIVPLLIESIKELQKKVQNIEENCDCLNK